MQLNKPMITAVLLTACLSGPYTAAIAQSDLNKLIRTESGALGGLEKDLGPQELQSIEGVAGKLGDPNLSKDVSKLQGGQQQFNLSSGGWAGDISALAKQVHNIPGIGPLLASFAGTASSTANQQQFSKPSVVSQLLHNNSATTIASHSASNGILGDISQIQSLCGAGSVQNQACQNELNQASTVMPAAIQNMNQENNEINQLLKE